MQACVFVAFFFFESATKETVESIQFCWIITDVVDIQLQ